jgi:RNA polymerase sigma factor (sigma-70 family)
MSGVRSVLRDLNTLFHCGAAGQLSDVELLERFVTGCDQAAESAFAALVDRHGAMVLGVCRRVLGDRHDAEDAFQATFLVLARKAAAIARREQLASWLHGVARRASLDARARSTRQRAIEKRRRVMFPAEPPDETVTSELRAVLDEELARLPERHRSAILLCELEGLSRRDAACRLGVSEGTLSSRLARAKAQLRGRLTRRGMALSSATLAAAIGRDAPAVTVPAALADSTIRVASLAAAGSSLAGVVSNSVATLTEGVLKAMLLAKLKSVILGLVTVALVTTGVGVLAQDRPSDEDRLKVLERKLDKLLEVLGGSSHRQPLADSVPARPTAAPGDAASADQPRYATREPQAPATAPAGAVPAPGGVPAIGPSSADGTDGTGRSNTRTTAAAQRTRSTAGAVVHFACASHAGVIGRSVWPQSKPRKYTCRGPASRVLARRSARVDGTAPRQSGATVPRIRAAARAGEFRWQPPRQSGGCPVTPRSTGVG